MRETHHTSGNDPAERQLSVITAARSASASISVGKPGNRISDHPIRDDGGVATFCSLFTVN